LSESRLRDDVPEPVKQRRLREVIDTFNAGARASNEEEVGKVHHVLVEALSKKSDAEWAGRTEHGKRVVLQRRPLPQLLPGELLPPPLSRSVGAAAGGAITGGGGVAGGGGGEAGGGGGCGVADVAPGDYVAVRVTHALSANTLRAEPLAKCGIARFAAASGGAGGGAV